MWRKGPPEPEFRSSGLFIGGGGVAITLKSWRLVEDLGKQLSLNPCRSLKNPAKPSENTENTI